MKKQTRLLAFVLAMLMVVSLMPMSALAAEEAAPVSAAESVLGAGLELLPEEETPAEETPAEPEATEAPVEETPEAAETPVEEAPEATEAPVEEAPAETGETETPVEEAPGLDGADGGEESLAAESLLELTLDGDTSLLASAIFFSDVHKSTSDLQSVMEGIGSAVTPAVVGFDGDTCLTVSVAESTVADGLGVNTDSFKDVYSYAADHDDENNSDIGDSWNFSGVAYGTESDEAFYVYVIREIDMEISDNGKTAAEAFTTWVNGLTDTSKPLFILSHRPLHARRNDNAGAPYWYTAIEAAAAKMDITFLWAHNHTGETSVDTDAYYVEKDGSEEFSVYNGSTVKPGFTYMNAGYINAGNQNPGRINVATTVGIYADSMVFQDYTTAGAYNGTHAHNVTVAREFASSGTSSPTLSSITVVRNKLMYSLGEELDITVTAIYSDGSTQEVTDYTTNFDSDTTGLQSVTVSYGGVSTTMEDVIVAAAIRHSDVYIVDDEDAVTYSELEEGTAEICREWICYLSNTQTLALDWEITENEDDTYTVTCIGPLSELGSEVTYTKSDDCVTLTSVDSAYADEGYATAVKTYSIGSDDTLSEETLSINSVTAQLSATAYTVGDELSFTKVYAEYQKTDGTTVTVDLEAGDYTVTVYDENDKECTDYMSVAGNYTAYVTYDGKTSEGYSFTVSEAEDITDSVSGITVSVAAAVISGVTIGETDYTGEIEGAQAYVAYYITPTDDGALNKGNYAEITFPIPEGYGEGTYEARVYCVDTEEWFEDIDADASTITVRTSHFSTWAVVNTDGEAETGTVDGYTSSTGDTEIKTVYVLTDAFSIGNDYLIANGNSGEVTLLGQSEGSAQTVAAEVITEGDYTYIETADAGYIWNATAHINDSYSNYPRLINAGEYAMYLSSTEVAFNSGLDATTGAVYTRYWTYEGEVLSCVSTNSGSTTYYLGYSDGAFSGSTSASTGIYIYEKREIGSDPVSGTLSLDAGEDQTVVLNTDEGATNTVTITPTAKVTATDGTVTVVEIPADAIYTYSVVSDTDKILASGDVTDGVFTLNAVAGTATIRVYVSWDMDGNGTVEEDEKIWDTVKITTTEPYYTIDITDGTKPVYTKAEITEFAEDVTYYTCDSEGNYTVVADGTEFNSGTTYYTVSYPSVESTIVLKGVTADDTYDLNHVLTRVDADGETESDAAVSWSSSNENVATVDKNGTVTLTGSNGSFTITVTYEIDENTAITDTVLFTANKENVYTPADGGGNFPEYPNEGAVRFDKTATAVGNFSETGIAQVELSMTGVPYTTGAELDVVLMLDITGSMTTDRISATKAAAIAFVESIVINEDGTYNDNRVGIYSFNANGTYTVYDLGTISDADELATVTTAINAYDGNRVEGGTPYDTALALVQTKLAAAKTDGTGDNRQQYAVFMTDGCPTSYQGTANEFSSANAIQGMFTGTDYNTRGTDYEYEYYSTAMKAAGITVYTVGLGLEATNTAWSGSTATQCLNAASILLNDISGPANEASQPDALSTTTLSKKDNYFFSVADADAAEDMESVFEDIAQKILQAATDVQVTDKIADEYTMIFALPTDVDEVPDGQEFYIEVVSYALDANHERDTETSLMKLYLGVGEDDNYYAASNASGTAFADPTFDTVVLGTAGTKYYWSTDSDKGDSGISVTVDGTTYCFVSDGSGTHNMTSGAYANGTIDSETGMSTDLIIATPYFVYNAAKQLLVWTTDQLSTTELALRYFLYLNDSAGSVGEDDEIDAGTYPTNEYAYLTYTNYLQNLVLQYFPVPQMTWNGAQVTYVFYLVNENGQPVNKAGQVVDFANAVYVTAPVTESMIWNDLEEYESLEVNLLAKEVLPDGYTIFDKGATYNIHVFEDENESNLNNHFYLDGDELLDFDGDGVADDLTTYVFNTKADDKYNKPGYYAASETFLCKDYNVTVNEDGTYTYTGSFDQYEDDGVYVYEEDDIGPYTIVEKTGAKVITGFDYSNTTVAFAVTWSTSLVPDTVVVDYGLPVEIRVTENDMVSGTLNSVSNEGYSDSYAMNTGIAETGFGEYTVSSMLTLDNGDMVGVNGDAVYYVQKDMVFDKPSVFYYDAKVTYYEDSSQLSGYIYSQVTVLPATTIYYEDSGTGFLELSSYTWEDSGWVENDNSQWTTEGETLTGEDALQDTDRPGVGSVDDANNLYGYDSHYTEMAQYSLGSASMINVDYDNYGKASFSFKGTGFDVISMTSNTTGTIIVDVYSDEAKETPYKSYVVDTYYGYKQVVDEDGITWETTDYNDPNALYQVPVMKVFDLAYGTYYVDIVATYDSIFGHDQYTDASYDFYLDAIRIYDPAGTTDTTDTTETIDETIQDAYVADREYDPDYYELRNWLIDAEIFNSLDENTTIEGVAFIDSVYTDGTTTGAGETSSVEDYTNIGPNNEVYLAPGQAVAFQLNAGAYAPEGYTVDTVQLALKSVGDTAYSKVWNAATSTVSSVSAKPISTATDMYYDITSLNGTTVVIYNAGEGAVTNEDGTVTSGDAILSITNIKVTYKETTDEDTATEEEATTDGAAGDEATEDSVFTVSLDAVDMAVFSLRTSDDTEEEAEEEITEDDLDEEVITSIQVVVTQIKNTLSKIKNTLSSILGQLGSLSGFGR